MTVEQVTRGGRDSVLKKLPADRREELLKIAADHNVGAADPIWSVVDLVGQLEAWRAEEMAAQQQQTDYLRRLAEEKQRELESIASSSAEAIHKPISDLTPQLTEAIDRLSAAGIAIAKSAAQQAGCRVTDKQANQMIKAAVARVDRSAGKVLREAVIYLLAGGGTLFIVGAVLGAAVRGSL